MGHHLVRGSRGCAYRHTRQKRRKAYLQESPEVSRWLALQRQIMERRVEGGHGGLQLTQGKTLTHLPEEIVVVLVMHQPLLEQPPQAHLHGNCRHSTSEPSQALNVCLTASRLTRASCAKDNHCCAYLLL